MSPVRYDALETRGPRSRREVEALADLYGKAFSGYGHHYRLYLRNVLEGVPRDEWRLSRALWTPDGTPLAQVRVCHRVMRLGAALVRVGGIGDVATHPFHRKRGLGRRLFEHIIEFLHSEKYDLSILWGIAKFYDKFGFIVALSDGTFQMRRDQVARITGPYRGRRVKRTDGGAVWRLFEADAAIRDGAMLRDRRRWLKHALRDKWMRVLEDPRGRLHAYYQASPDGDALALREVSLGRKPTTAAIRSVIADMVTLAKRCEKPNLRFGLPPTHPLGQFAIADGCEIRRHIGHRGGVMARIGHLEVLCNSMAPEWERLLAASPAARWAGRLRLRVTDPSAPLGAGMGTVDLAIRRGRLRPEPPKGRTPAVITAGQDKLTRLVLGFHTPAAAQMLGEVKLTRAAEPLAAAIFPPRHITVFGPDHF